MKVDSMYTNPTMSNHQVEIVGRKPFAVACIIWRGGKQKWKFNIRYMTKLNVKLIKKSLSDFAENSMEI
ncbi:hypothetical protein [Leptospira sp. GIMC2001]|uniref:hypothetical protein n=1 Tax=Leptospira sp. GIMC2001 TaxID=1513297 RepID=UPI00234A80E9|nr:hypothetical protein [Leptospira sp. GIMC2001]WCL51441.1 hypothetical protein O4O04_20205 [Leptospira sp. GIMC2001]